jgi:hypothetical protein
MTQIRVGGFSPEFQPDDPRLDDDAAHPLPGAASLSQELQPIGRRLAAPDATAFPFPGAAPRAAATVAATIPIGAFFSPSPRIRAGRGRRPSPSSRPSQPARRKRGVAATAKRCDREFFLRAVRSRKGRRRYRGRGPSASPRGREQRSISLLPASSRRCARCGRGYRRHRTRAPIDEVEIRAFVQ